MLNWLKSIIVSHEAMEIERKIEEGKVNSILLYCKGGM